MNKKIDQKPVYGNKRGRCVETCYASYPKDPNIHDVYRDKGATKKAKCKKIMSYIYTNYDHTKSKFSNFMSCFNPLSSCKRHFLTYFDPPYKFGFHSDAATCKAGYRKKTYTGLCVGDYECKDIGFMDCVNGCALN